MKHEDGSDALISAAEKAIKDFKFWNYGMSDVDPEDEYAEWVPDLAREVAAAVRAKVAEEIKQIGLAALDDHALTVDEGMAAERTIPPSLKWFIEDYLPAALARGEA